MPPPDLTPFLDPLPARFPGAWAKAQTPHDDGEFNARSASVLFYEHGLAQVGRNGKRGNPADLSKDILNWRAAPGETGPNPDPRGGSGWIIDFIPGHGAPGATIGQQFPDPRGPGAWVLPLTLAQVDQLYGPDDQATVLPSYEDIGGDPVWDAVQAQLIADYTRFHRLIDDQSGRWVGRTIYDVLVLNVPGDTWPDRVSASVDKHRLEWWAGLEQAAGQARPMPPRRR